MVRLVQLLCPNRHCIVAAPYEESKSSPSQAQAELAATFKAMCFKPWCAICGSPDLRYEDSATHYQTMQDAAQPRTEQMLAQLNTRAALDQAGLTHDKARLN